MKESVTLLNERRWSTSSWLVLAVVLALLLGPLAIGLIQMSQPSDGWAAAPSDNDSGSYTMLYPVDGRSGASLQPGDAVVAIDGRALQRGEWPPLPAELRASQIMDYVIERAGSSQAVSVTLIRTGLSGYLVSLWRVLSTDLILTGVSIVSLLLAGMVFVLRPSNPSSWYLLLIFTIFSGTAFLIEATQSLYHYQFPGPILFVSALFDYSWIIIFMPSLALLTLSFPVAKWPVRHYPRLVPALFFGIPLMLSAGFSAYAAWTRNPGPVTTPVIITTLAIAVTCLGTAAIALIHNLFTIRAPLARAQMQWFALGLGLGLVVPLMASFAITGGSFNFTTPLQKAVSSVATVMILLLPISLAVGILRYRLFDIDVIIRRTTSYAILTGLLVLVYFGSVVVLQRILAPITGESTIAVVLSTLLIAALFLPLRRRIQNAIDKRFFRRKYDAEQVLEQFAATVRDETDLDELTAELVRVIQETMQPESVSIWLAPLSNQHSIDEVKL